MKKDLFKMTQNLVFIIDRSASVQLYTKNYTEAINGILQAQKRINPNTMLTCALFNDFISYICLNKPLKAFERPVKEDDINPSGMTAFHDNVSTIVNNLMIFYQDYPHISPPIAIILTDGEDTSSRLFVEKHTAMHINAAKQKGWQFIYLGVTQTSMRLGRFLGCNACVLYNTTQRSFEEIPKVIERLLSERQVPNVDIDIRSITDCLTEMKLE